MFIKVEETPNPDTYKFIPEEKIDVDNTILFNSKDKCDNAPFIKNLLGLDGVESILLDKEFISVTKEKNESWDVLKAILSSKISDFIQSKKPLILNKIQETKTDIKTETDPISLKIIELLKDKVKPVVASHGGDITFHSYKKGTVFLELKGSCSGCPSSTATLKMGIENMLKHYIPEIKEVLDISQD